MRAKTIRDAVHGDINLDAIEMEVVDTIPFQRLRGIKQLGTSNLIFPSATHSRFEHSLGTCWLTKKMLAALRENVCQPQLLKEHEPGLCMAALLHDITHIPFGHTFEDERRIFPRHDENPERLQSFLCQNPIRDILNKHGIQELVLDLLDKRRTPNYPEIKLMREIISGTVCADLLDYLKRDAFFCGLHLDYDNRLYRYLTVLDGRLVFDLQKNGLFRADALSELIHLLRLRYTLTERVYYHHGKVIAGAMVSRALELALKAESIRPEELNKLQDDSFLWILASRSESDDGVSLILNELFAHRFYRCAFLLRPESLMGAGVSPGVKLDLEKRFHFNEEGEREAIENQLAEHLGLHPSEVLVYCPSAQMALKEASMQVLVDSGIPVSLSELRYPEVEVLLGKHRALWRFGVYLRRGNESGMAKAGKFCEDLIGQRNMLAERGRI